jgi:DNA modification methylase
LAYWQTFEYMFILSKGKPAYVHRLDNGKSRSKGGKKTGRITPDGKQKVEIRSDGDGKLQLRNNVWEYNVGFCSGDDKTSHPAVFPEQLANDHIISWSNEGDTVLDCFMGSGTTGKMALLNNRKFIGIEKDAGYFEIAKQRLGSNSI